MDNYDKTKEYTKYVKPIVSELKKECGLNNIPFLFTAAIKNSESETVYKNEMLLAQTHVSLTDKRIARMLLRFRHKASRIRYCSDEDTGGILRSKCCTRFCAGYAIAGSSIGRFAENCKRDVQSDHHCPIFD